MNVLLDTSIFMSLFVKDSHFQKSESLFWDIIKNYNGFFCSMSVDEIIWVLRRSGHDKNFIEGKVNLLFTLPLRFLTPHLDNFIESLRIMEKYHVSFSDSQIAAHAVLKGLKVATLDKDFEKISEIQIWNK
ncbi:MAG: PIN domain-containing protein [Theionarchaea archaeon]|nr:PIN domain-containing protein [Theionarchaea archaeon]